MQKRKVMLFKPYVCWTCVSLVLFFNGSLAQFGRFASARFPWRRNLPVQTVRPSMQPWRSQGGPAGTSPLTMREVALRQQMEVLRRQLNQMQSREIGVTRGAGSVIDNPRGLRNRFNRGFQPEQLVPPSPDIQPFPFNNVDESNVVVLEPPPGTAPGNRPSISEISPIDRTRPVPNFDPPFTGTPVDPRDVTVVTDTGILPGSVDTGVVDPTIGVVDPTIGVVDPTIGVVDPSVVINDGSDPTLIVPDGGYTGGAVPVDPSVVIKDGLDPTLVVPDGGYIGGVVPVDPVIPVHDKSPVDPLIVPVDPFIPGQDKSPVDPMVVPVDPSLIGTGPLPVTPDALSPRDLEWEKARLERRRNRMMRRKLRKQKRKMLRKALRNKDNVDKPFFTKVIVPTTPKPAPPPPPPKKKKPTNLLANIGLGLALGSLFFG